MLYELKFAIRISGEFVGAMKTEPTDVGSKKSTVQSLSKGLRVLETFTADEPELTMAEIARRGQMDNATAFRYLNTLVDLGYVRRIRGTRLFCLSLKVLDLGFNAISHSSLRTVARPILKNLVGEINEAASVGVLEGTDIYYIERVQLGITRMGVDIRIGTKVPAGSTVIGHALLAWLPEDQQREILSRTNPGSLPNGSSEDDYRPVMEKLAQVRRRGYAISDPSNVAGFYAVAAPITDSDQVPLGALSAAAPAIGITLEQFADKSAGPVCEAARKLSLALQSLGVNSTIESSASV